MTKKGIEVTRNWSDSMRKLTKERITVYTYTNNIPSKAKTMLI